MIIKKILSRLIAKYHETKIHWHPRLLYRNENAINITRPIFFLGVQGGGLTIMSRLIRLLPDIVYLSGNKKFWAGKDELHNSSKFKSMPDALTLRSPGYYNLLGHEKNHPDFGYERAFVYASNEFLNEYRLTDKDWTLELEKALKKVIRRCLCVYADNPTKAQFLDMSQSYILKIPFLRKCFPDAKFIIVSRDPYAVCWKQAQTSLIFKKDPQRAVKLAAEHWFNSFYYGLKDTEDKKDVLLLRFEDFMQEPIAVSKKIFYFLDKSYVNVEKLITQHKKTPLGSEDREKWFPINIKANKRHHDAIPVWAKDIITPICQPLIEKFHYSAVDKQA